MGDLAEAVNNRAPYNFRFDYQFDKNGDPLNAYCRSNHYMDARYGIPVTFFSANAWYRDYQMVSDERQYVAYDRMTRIGQYIRVSATSATSASPREPFPQPPSRSSGARAVTETSTAATLRSAENAEKR